MLSLDEDNRDDITQISPVDNEKLVAVFTEQEVKETVFKMKYNKAPGPDGFLAEFYQIFWEAIKGDLMSLFKDFYENKLPLFNLNFEIITLLPKQQEASHIKQYRPICLLDVSFKIFTKEMVNRMTRIASKLISPSQMAFMSDTLYKYLLNLKFCMLIENDMSYLFIFLLIFHKPLEVCF
jgi:hypothetical protein